jgi:hypothetical protein
MQDLIAKLESCLEEAKKLTTKDRKKLKKGTFCGPNRSFPVNDCKHAATAKAYLGRSKFSKSVKQKIAACINRRAKLLGCPKGKPAKAEFEFSEQEILDFMNDSAWEETKALIDFFAEELEDE